MNNDGVTKIVKYLGQEFSVPEWAKFIAGDCSRDVYVYDMAPVFDGTHWVAVNNIYYFVGELSNTTNPCEAI